MSTNVDSPLSPAGMLDLAQRQEADVQRRMARGVPWIIGVWAVAWFVGFLLFWLESIGILPTPTAIVTAVALGVAAIAASIVLSVRIGRGIRQTNDSAFTGTVFGVSWTVAIVAMVVFYLGMVHNGMSPQLSTLFLPVGIALVVGLLFGVGGGIWRSWVMIGAGLVVVAGALIAPFLGQPTHFLVLSIAGLLGFGGAAVLTARWAASVGRAA